MDDKFKRTMRQLDFALTALTIAVGILAVLVGIIAFGHVRRFMGW